MNEIKINLLCCATILGHICGFAAINAFGALQQASKELLWDGAVPVIAGVSLLTLYRGANMLRYYVAKIDGVVDEYEKLWNEDVIETENDVVDLCISFLVVQEFRFLINGSLPDVEGNFDIYSR